MNNLTIKFKLYILAGVISLSIITLSITILSTFSDLKALNAILTLSKSNETNMLTLRRNEKDFLARLDLKYQKKFNTNFDSLIDRINITSNYSQNLGLEVEEDFSELVQYLQAYKSSFNKIITLQQKTGLTHNSGMRGELRKSVHNAEAILKQSNLIKLTADMLMLRRNEKDFMLRRLDKYLGKFDKNYGIFMHNLNLSTASYELKNEIAPAMKLYYAKFVDFSNLYKELGLTSKKGLQGEMRASVHKTEEIFKLLNEEITSEIASKNNSIFTILLVTTGVFIVFILGVILTIMHSINTRLGLLHGHLSDVALKSGDLSTSINITGNDEITIISQLFNQFVRNLKETFIQIPALSDSLEKASNINTDISESTHQLAVSQQAKSDEVSSATQQMFAASEDITKNIQVAANYAEEAKESVSKGKHAFQEVSSTINSLADRLQSATKVTTNLEENSNSISTVLDVIRGIAEQTNLLALNAAIEAARAGEQGRGFAVVADEVRTLASRTQDSTTQIQSLIENLQANVKNTVSAMGEGSAQAASTAQNASNAIDVLTDITGSVNNIFELNSSIASASEEQSAISHSITENILSIKEAAEETTSEANRANVSSTELKEIASSLQSLISTYKF